MKKIFKSNKKQTNDAKGGPPRDSDTGPVYPIDDSQLDSPKKPTRADEAYLSSLANNILKKKAADRSVEAETQDTSGANPYGDMLKNLSSEGVDPIPQTSMQRISKGQGVRKYDDLPAPSSANVRVPQAIPPTAPKPATPPVSPAIQPDPPSSFGIDGTFVVGTILLFEDDSICIYKDQRTAKEYEVVTMLQPNGRIRAQGIALQQYDITPIGTLPKDFMVRMQRRKTWERDEIVYHLDSFEYCKFIPFPDTEMLHPSGVSEFEETSVPPQPSDRIEPDPDSGEERTLVIGRRFSINFGNKEWDAVYWGKDDLGPVVAHNTHNKWALMHLDLRRFDDSLKLGPMAEPDVLDKIRRDIG